MRSIGLSGGGARCAYEAGVLPDLVDERPRRMGHPPRLDVVIRPSADVLLLAGHVLAERRNRGKLTPMLRAFLLGVNASGVPSESDLLSYLLFDEDFTAPMTELGMADARAREGKLVRFFTDP